MYTTPTCLGQGAAQPVPAVCQLLLRLCSLHGTELPPGNPEGGHHRTAAPSSLLLLSQGTGMTKLKANSRGPC